MRGAVTVAAAQTLPFDTPSRPLLVLIAFVVAAGSLLLQGGTLARFVRWIRPGGSQDGGSDAERGELLALLAEVRTDLIGTLPSTELPKAASAALDQVEPAQLAAARDLVIRIAEAQRATLLDARDDGLFSASLLEEMLQRLDSAQISIELYR